MVTEDTSPLGGRACAYNTELALVRESFLKGRYKKCAALCESLQPRDVSLPFSVFDHLHLVKATANIITRPRKVTPALSGLLVVLSRHLS